jgi:RNA polymerase sigma-70 factor (ECF subfamily)
VIAVQGRFEELAGPFRRELLAHCYRMTGGWSDAEDALQETLVRAWRGFDQFEGRASLRTWLYKIATNTCLDLLTSKRSRTMPELNDASSESEPLWLEPFPEPEAAFANREAIRLAFIVALQVLPPRQRATLILRDVVGMSADETAAALDTSVAAVNSALQRAREALDEQPRAQRAPITEAIGELLGRYLRAWESGDADGLVALLTRDAVLSMPPMPMWFRGPEAIAEFVRTNIFPRGELRLVPCRANGAPAFGVYQAGGFIGVSVVDVDGGHVAGIHTFLGVDPAPFGLAATAPSAAVLLPGGRLGRYRLEQVLGAGGMGTVWLAHDTQLDRRVALKVLQSALATDPLARERLLREARAMAKLRHPNIITVFDAGEIDGIDFIAMELVDGEDLASWLRRAPSVDDVLDKLVAAGQGLAAAHAAGVVHRDFKPDNVLVARDGRVLVSDFGLARSSVTSGSSPPTAPIARGSGSTTVADHPRARRDAAHDATLPAPPSGSLTDAGAVLGTPAYMSPEQASGAEVDGRADQFAFCVTAWEALGGERPTGGDLGDRVPERFAAILRRGLAPDPQARFASMDALLEALTKIRSSAL